MGQGPLVFVLHGGPGFDHSYLVSAFEPLAEKRTLVFYDQPGSGQSCSISDTLSPLQIFSHFRCLSHSLCNGQPAGVIAHSWGSLVFIASLLDEQLKGQPVAHFQEGLLINPVPVSSGKYMACAKNLLKRIGFVDRLKLSWLAVSDSDGGKIMDLLLPYYVNHKSSLPHNKPSLNKKTYLKISSQLKDFDYSAHLDQLPRLSALSGACDFITSNLVDDLTPCFSTLHIMERVGHYPFREEPNDFRNILFSSFV